MLTSVYGLPGYCCTLHLVFAILLTMYTHTDMFIGAHCQTALKVELGECYILFACNG